MTAGSGAREVRRRVVHRLLRRLMTGGAVAVSPMVGFVTGLATSIGRQRHGSAVAIPARDFCVELVSERQLAHEQRCRRNTE